MNEHFPTRDSRDETGRVPMPPPTACGARFEEPGEERWQKFAQDDPYRYILTSLKRDDSKEFWESGERTVRTELIPMLRLYGVRPKRCLEVGCGVGRLAIPLARFFEQVVGVDIAPEMVRRATALASEKGAKNISFKAVSGPLDFLQQGDSYTGKCDFIYSLLVFQHIRQFVAISGYLHAIRALLHQQGLAYLQFDTRPRTWSYQLKTWLPDFLLPRFWRRGIRRIRRTPEEIKEVIRHAGLEIVGELDSHSAYHRYLLRLPQSGASTR